MSKREGEEKWKGEEQWERKGRRQREEKEKVTERKKEGKGQILFYPLQVNSRISGFWNSRISGKISIRCIPARNGEPLTDAIWHAWRSKIQ